MPTTAFVAHSDCPRHDTGWGDPDHQGRLPAITRAVYRDMLTLHGHLAETEARPATPDDLRRVHGAEHVERVRALAAEATARGEVLRMGETPVSGATWDAALAAAGTAITGVETVWSGEARNAFCLARPHGGGATRDAPGRLGFFSNVAVAARYARERLGAGRVVVVSWSDAPPDALAGLLADEPGIDLAAVHRDPRAFPEGAEAADAGTASPVDGDGAADAAGGTHVAETVPPGAGGGAFAAAQRHALERLPTDPPPEGVILAAGFELLAGDPLGRLGVRPEEVHPLTAELRAWAEARCGGRLVSVLEGGWDAAATARAVVQQVRALAALPAA